MCFIASSCDDYVFKIGIKLWAKSFVCIKLWICFVAMKTCFRIGENMIISCLCIYLYAVDENVYAFVFAQARGLRGVHKNLACEQICFVI